MSTTPEKHTFQAEVQQLLNIVINSLYTDKEIFIRELISNAADASEKLRFLQASGENVIEPDTEMKISITTDDNANTITISDNGVGMTHDELVENLGRIAYSGSKQFIEKLKAAQVEGGTAQSNTAELIGQFGVGFYSAFMAADTVDVYTRSWRPDESAWHWHSDGASGYEIEPTEGQGRGSRIVLHLKEDAREFSSSTRIRHIIENYSNFVPLPIELNGERVNKVEALWTRSKSEITGEEYTEFYKFIGNDFEAPRLHLHFSADAPLNINSILFVPQRNLEKMGFSRLEHQVQLYCRKVLIMSKADGLLPEWMRFVRGVVDSEDLPLNISRETMQDSALLQKLNQVLTRRFLRFLEDTAGKEPENYDKFYAEFGRFLKEGVMNDFANQEGLSKLLRYESSLLDDGKTTSLADYVARMKDEQKAIYYLHAPSRKTAEASPYFEVLKSKGYEVLFVYDPWDEFVMDRLGKFDEKDITAAEKADLTIDELSESADKLDDDSARLTANFIKETLGDRINEVKVSKRLVDSPAVLTDEGNPMTTGMRRMMREIQRAQSAGVDGGEDEGKSELDPLGMGGPTGGGMKFDLEINPSHSLIKKLNSARSEKPDAAKLVAEQLWDNSLIAAGLMDDPREMLGRLHSLLERALH